MKFEAVYHIASDNYCYMNNSNELIVNLKTGYDVKYQLNLLSHSDVKINGRILDVELMHYLLDPEKTHKLDILAKSYLGTSLEQEDKGGFTGSLFADEETADQPRSKIKEAVIPETMV